MSRRTPKESRDKARGAAKLTVHRGLATWGEKLVPLDDFRQATAEAGRRLSPAGRDRAVAGFLAAAPDPTPVEGPYSRVAVFGGVYNNHYALTALLEDAAARGAEAIYCLGDLGGFGPHPDRIWPLLQEGGVRSIQGNYEESLSTGHKNCNCGYTDPRDNHFAELSYGYTERNCSVDFKRWMGELPARRRIRVGDRELLLVHGSPRRINEFLFHSTSPTPFLEALLDRESSDAFLCTHTGLPWHRHLPSGRHAANVGVIGRPANDGRTEVWYCMLGERNGALDIELVPLAYDHSSLAAEMRREELPEEFVETVLTGWWTTCLEILPAKERAASRC